MLKPIPQEHPGSSKNIHHFSRKSKKKNKSPAFMRIEMKIRNLGKGDSQLFMVAGKKLMEYIKKAENISMNELNELIHSLQRTIIGLQKKRIHMVRREQQKKKKNN